MSVKVHLSSNLRGPTGGLADMEASGTTVGALIDDLDSRFPGLGGLLRVGTSAVVDGVLIAHPEYEKVSDGAEVYFIPPSCRRLSRRVAAPKLSEAEPQSRSPLRLPGSPPHKS